MATTRGVRSAGRRGDPLPPGALPPGALSPGPTESRPAPPGPPPSPGLTGFRYLLAVTVLVALASVPMLLAMLAGAATLREPPPAVDASPFVTYRTYPGPPAPGDAGWW